MEALKGAVVFVSQAGKAACGGGGPEHFFVLIKTSEAFVWGWLIREKESWSLRFRRRRPDVLYRGGLDLTGVLISVEDVCRQTRGITT